MRAFYSHMAWMTENNHLNRGFGEQSSGLVKWWEDYVEISERKVAQKG